MLTKALEIQNRLSQIFDNAGLEVIVTCDPPKANPAISAGQSAVIITVPARKFEAPRVVSATWEIWILAPQLVDVPTAWATLDSLLDIARQGVEIIEARPDVFNPAQGQGIPALVCTFETTYHEE